MTRSGSRRLSLGPVFAYDWIRFSRRWQGYALRSSFVLFLLIASPYIWMNTISYPLKSNIRLMAELGEWFFQAVIGTRLTLVLLAAPAATAGAICLDKARGTLTHRRRPRPSRPVSCRRTQVSRSGSTDCKSRLASSF